MESLILACIGAALLMAGFFAGIEVAFVSANKISIELKKKQGLKSGRILSDFLESPAKFIGTTLIGINLATILYAVLVGEYFTYIWEWIQGFFVKEARPYFTYIRLVFDSILATIIIVMVKFTFRAIFRAKNDTLLSFFAPLINFFYGLLYPIASFFVSIAEWILKYLFNVRVNDEKEPFTRVDLEQFIQQTREQSEDNPELNTELFEAALSLPTVKIRQCLVPRKEVEAVEVNTPMDMLQRKFIDTKLSKLVVYEKNIDNILGYVHQLALFRKPTDIRSVLLPIPAVPESMSATDLINKFSRERKSIAWVVDEFGGTSGIITMEDLLEEIFGEIQDEYDTEEFVEKQIADKEYIFSGRLELDYIKQKYNLELPESDSETLSGFIINQHEKIPGDRERIIIDDFEFEILNVSDTRIETVKMKVLQ
ncbi:MAG TPA: hemolysin family protein [Chitinophagaceae bacterium]|nr:hemolysin family protein [Chitinophagaceae bacterium]